MAKTSRRKRRSSGRFTPLAVDKAIELADMPRSTFYANVLPYLDVRHIGRRSYVSTQSLQRFFNRLSR